MKIEGVPLGTAVTMLAICAPEQRFSLKAYAARFAGKHRASLHRRGFVGQRFRCRAIRPLTEAAPLLLLEF